MLFHYDEHRADVRNAYGKMVIQEANDAHKKKIQKAVTAFIKDNKSDFKDYNSAMKIVKEIPNKDEEVDIIGLIADLSNTMKDSSDHQEELDKLIDMV
jgi:hypothetical protein